MLCWGAESRKIHLSAAGAASWSITEGNLTEYTAVFPETKEITNAEAKNLYDADKALILLPQEFAAKTGDGDMTGGTLEMCCCKKPILQISSKRR